jgi:hypothetical protein
MSRKTLTVTNPHSQKKETYEGVALEEILRKAGVPTGEQMRGPAMTTYVVFEAADNYRVVFSLAELDSGILDSDVIVADTMDGAPLPGKSRPVSPHRSAREASCALDPHAQIHHRCSRAVAPAFSIELA